MINLVEAVAVDVIKVLSELRDRLVVVITCY